MCVCVFFKPDSKSHHGEICGVDLSSGVLTGLLLMRRRAGSHANRNMLSPPGSVAVFDAYDNVSLFFFFY